MVQDRTLLMTMRLFSRKAALPSVKTILLISVLALSGISAFGQHQGDTLQQNRQPLSIVIGGTWTRHLIAGGWGLSLGVQAGRAEVSLGGEMNAGQYGVILAGRYALQKGSTLVVPFLGLRTSYYYSKWHLGLAPGYMINGALSIGLKCYLLPRISAEGQLGIGYGGYFRQNGEPFFTTTWLPTRMLHFGMAFDFPVPARKLEMVATDKPSSSLRVGKFSLLLQTGLQINTLAPPSFERFTAGLAYDVHPRLGLTLRHQAVRTINGLKYGKSLLGVRWMPGTGTGLRWVGSLEAGHWGSTLNFRSPIGAIGVMVGQHLQYPILSGVAVDLGLQYAILKAPQPLQPASSDFETGLGLVIRPGAWRKRD